MDKAKYHYSSGKHRTVTADQLEKEYAYSISSNTRRFTCLECGEYVTFVYRDIYKSYFKHTNSNETTKSCELRSNSNQNFTIYKRVGLPLYLKKASPEKFELYMGFYSIDKTLMDIADKESFKIDIKPYGENDSLSVSYYINENNFSLDSTTLKRITFITQQYKLKYSTEKAEELLARKWGSHAEGLLNSEALFSYGENGGRKVRINDEITTDTDYFYLCKNVNVLIKYGDAEHEYLGIIALKHSYINMKYKVYRINFKPKSENQFDNLYNFCRDNFRVSLIRKPSELIPIWPPPIYTDNVISYLDHVKETTFMLKSDEDNPRVFIHEGSSNRQFNGEQLDDDKYLIKFPVSKEKTAININEKYNSISMFMQNYQDEILTHSNNFVIEDEHNNHVSKGSYFTLPPKELIRISAKSKCSILHFKKDIFYREYTIKSEKGVTIEAVNFGDKMVAVSGIVNTPLLEYVKKVSETGSSISEELLCLGLCKLGDPMIAPPLWLKKFLALLKSNSKAYKLVRGYLVQNRMPAAADKILANAYKTLKDGAKFGEG